MFLGCCFVLLVGFGKVSFDVFVGLPSDPFGILSHPKGSSEGKQKANQSYRRLLALLASCFFENFLLGLSLGPPKFGVGYLIWLLVGTPWQVRTNIMSTAKSRSPSLTKMKAISEW